MNALKISFLFLFFAGAINAQINLVPNPSFEDTVFCPSVSDNMQDVQDWSSFGNSADYFNGCSATPTNVPYTAFGYQLAHSGTAFCGVVTYLKANHPNGNNYREYIGVQLLTPLQIGTRYYFSFYAVSAQHYGSIGFFSNNIGLRFFTNSYSKLNPAPVDNFAHIKLDTLLNDTVNWLRISGSFIADSIYQYVSIGNFYDYLNTDTLIFTSSNPFCAYSYIDDVCVTTDSLFNETWTGLQNIELNEIHIWPNPVQNYFQFSAKQLIDEVTIYDSRGKLIKSENVNALEGRIDFDVLSDGIYFAVFRKERDFSVYKFLKF
ncbi:MAG: T9SS type A sorting domain-containing protein [Bacteroidetes bacterium]|nr:T9SS type A sorting domain-containing protein [Bacteroidota bacterium]